MKKKFIVFLGLFTLVMFAHAKGQDENAAGDRRALVVNSNFSDPAPKKTLAKIVERFEQEYPDIKIQLNIFASEAYKTNIRNFLSSEAPDVALWFAGNRMKYFVDQGLFEDISGYMDSIRERRFFLIAFCTHSGWQAIWGSCFILPMGYLLSKRYI